MAEISTSVPQLEHLTLGRMPAKSMLVTMANCPRSCYLSLSLVVTAQRLGWRTSRRGAFPQPARRQHGQQSSHHAPVRLRNGKPVPDPSRSGMAGGGKGKRAGGRRGGDQIRDHDSKGDKQGPSGAESAAALVPVVEPVRRWRCNGRDADEALCVCREQERADSRASRTRDPRGRTTGRLDATRRRYSRQSDLLGGDGCATTAAMVVVSWWTRDGQRMPLEAATDTGGDSLHAVAT